MSFLEKRICDLKTKKSLLDFANKYSYTVQNTKTKHSIKNELIDMVKNIKIKTIEVVLNEDNSRNNPSNVLIYKGSDGLFYDSNAKLLSEYLQNCKIDELQNKIEQLKALIMYKRKLRSLN